jgi:hypothetical protein
MATRKALCVGINVFKNYPGATLQGCVNDVDDISKVLKSHLGFSENEITRLTNEQATKVNIMNNLRSIVAEARDGKLSYLVFSLSSHGTQVPDITGEEPDRADEAFCPHDLAQAGNQWDKNHIILDDELNQLMLQIPNNVLVEVVLDTCHSGTGLKGIDMLLERRPRFLPPPSLEAFLEVENRTLRGMPHHIVDKGLTHQILWAACRADQTSADARIGGSWHGAFTYFFCKEIRDNNNRWNRRELLKKVRLDLSRGRYTQIPQLECPAASRTLIISGPERAASTTA